ncbi:c-type cytochrome biogenesis protein CcsB, partial [Kribbia dieselivorans]|uniref:c-type cytochrome biogenesis protein CcsB n=1 Tax=Kribbia dieselivorans TaxID=331526 RepID=UPI0008396716
GGSAGSGEVSGVVTPAPRPSEGATEASLRGRKAAALGYNFAWLTTALLAVSVTLRGLSVTRFPLGNMFEFAVAACLVVMLGFCLWSLRRDLRWMGAFVTLPVLLVLGAAMTVWYTEASELLPALKSYWLVIHVTIAVIAMSLFFFGFVALLLHLAQARREASGAQTWLARLPNSVALERLAYSIHIIAFPLWTFSILAGAIWARQAWGSYWNWDPKEVWSFIIWAVYAAYLHARATKGVGRNTATWIGIAGFVCIIVNYAIVNQFFVGQHSYSGL